MTLDVTVHLCPTAQLPVFLRRFEKLFIRGNEESSPVTVDIRRGLYTGLDYFVSTQGKCAGVVTSAKIGGPTHRLVFNESDLDDVGIGEIDSPVGAAFITS